jgi:hypothetical protein
MEHYVPGQGGHVLVKAGKEYELPAGREIVQELPLIRRVISTPFNGSSNSDTEPSFFIAINPEAIGPFRQYAERHEIDGLPPKAPEGELLKALIHPHFCWIAGLYTP